MIFYNFTTLLTLKCEWQSRRQILGEVVKFHHYTLSEFFPFARKAEIGDATVLLELVIYFYILSLLTH